MGGVIHTHCHRAEGAVCVTPNRRPSYLNPFCSKEWDVDRGVREGEGGGGGGDVCFCVPPLARPCTDVPPSDSGEILIGRGPTTPAPQRSYGISTDLAT